MLSRLVLATAIALTAVLLAGGCRDDGDDGAEPETSQESSTTTGSDDPASGRAQALTVSVEDLPEGWEEINVESSDPSSCLLDVGDEELVEASATAGFQTADGADQRSLSSLGIVTTSDAVAADALERVADGTVAGCLEEGVQAAFGSLGAEVSDLQVSHRQVDVPEGEAASTSVSLTVSAAGDVAEVLQEQLVIVEGSEVAVIGITSVDGPVPEDARSAAIEAVTAVLR